MTATDEATNAEQCEIFKLEKANISYLADDKIYTVIYLSENDSYSVQEEIEEPFSWSENAYAKETPTPDTRFVTVDYDKDDYYQFTAYDMTSKQFKEYCKKGKDSGFNNDIEEDEDSFFGTNSNGLRLYVRYLKYMNCIEVQVEME